MAAALYLQRFPTAEVGSAGTNACAGCAANERAVAQMTARGVDISAHESRLFGAKLVAPGDVVYCMSDEHVRDVQKTRGLPADVVVSRLSEAAGTAENIPDPLLIDTDEAYRTCADRLAELIDELPDPHEPRA
jgi:protein-tyrosine-phosphatase